MRPPWWPKELPWANVRMDARTEDEKQKVKISGQIQLFILFSSKIFMK